MARGSQQYFYYSLSLESSAGVAESFRRRPAEPLYMGSIPIPSSYDPSLYKNDLTPFLWELKKRGYRESTIVENYAKILKNLTKNCILDNPDSVLTYLATKELSEGRKELIADCYANYCQWKKISFINPRYHRIDKLPIIPLEKDIE